MAEDSISDWSIERIGKTFPIQLVEYNPDWNIIFLKEMQQISEVISTKFDFKIYHIGSTAISGIISKNTIDMILEINKTADIDDITHKLKDLNYQAVPQPDNKAPSLMYAKGYHSETVKQTYHLHLRFPEKHDEVVFAAYLNSHAELAKEYELLKIGLAKKYQNNREKYTEGKTSFVLKVLKMAKSD